MTFRRWSRARRRSGLGGNGTRKDRVVVGVVEDCWRDDCRDNVAGEAGRAAIERRDFRDGNGSGVGAGYEFRIHWSISGDALFLRFGANDNHTVLLATAGDFFY